MHDGTPSELDAILDAGPWAAFVFRLAPDGSFSVPYASAGLARLLGVELEVLRADAGVLFERMWPEDAGRCREVIAASARGLTPWRAEWRQSTPAGGVVWLEGRSTPIRDADGGTTWRGFVQETTDRHPVELQMESALALLRLFLAQAPLPLALLDRELRYVAASQAWGRVFGHPVETLLGRLHNEVFPGLNERFLAAQRAGLAGEVRAREEDPWTRADGTLAWFRWAVHPWRGSDGGVIGILIETEDVTARKTAEIGLRASEQRYRDLLAVAPDAILVHRDQRVLLANPAAAELFGVASADELVGRSVSDLMPPEDHPAVQEGVRTLNGGERGTLRVEARTVGVDGRVRIVEAAATRFRDVDGDRSVQVILRDVTDQRRIDAALREGEERLAAIVGSAMDGIVTADDRQVVVLANTAAEQMFGYPPGAMLGLPLGALMPARFRESHARHVEAFGATGVTHRSMGQPSKVRALRASGEEFLIEATISQAEVGGRKHYTVIHRDNGERVRAEEALRAEEERFRQLAEAIREVFWLTDASKRQMIYVSPAYETIWGRSTAELYASPHQWLEAVHPEDRERIRAAASLEHIETYDEEYRILRPDGTVRWVHDRAFPVRDAGGRLVRLAGVAEDITERRVLEEQLRQTQKMESVGRLAGGVAHDFNNLLTVIVSSAELVRDESPGSPLWPELVQDILDAGRRGASLTRQLLAFTRQEVVEPRVMDLADVVQDAEKLLRRLIGEDVRLVTRLRSARAPVRIDPGQWSQVLLNLAVNARDAMPSGGCLTIETDAVDVDSGFERRHPGMRGKRHAVLRVRDDGQGMSAEVRSRIFEPFFTTKARGKGTGLGLSVVYGVVHQAGGEIEVASEPGEGTTFTVYLPAVQEDASSPSDTPPSPSLTGDEVVLVVEDEAPVRRVVTRILAAKGYRVLSAEDGAQALRLLDEHRGPVNLLLTDVVLPGLDGPSLASEVRGRFPATKVLFASGYIDDSISRRGISGEGVDFLQKPYSPAVLLRRVRALLDG